MAPSWLRVQLVLADDAWLRRLNRQFRGHDRATDVLSFLYDGSRRLDPAEPHAELYVSMAQARVQASERRQSLSQVLVQLALHGMLHLQGHDHLKPNDSRKMRAAERRHTRWLEREFGWRRLPLLVPTSGTAAD
ncbi:MAG: rRNA maturation RNase YbeY [Candidatus Latescibacterota bacterium]|nr:MAG: rRNA maturation RNase YbeY [Candidatus Latescibacterota bacterium]